VTRVLFLTESFHPVLGGGETHIRGLGAALSRAGDQAVVVTRRADPSWPREERVDGIRVVRVPPPGPSRRGKYAMVPHAVRAVSRLAPTCDVVVVRGTRVLGLPGLLAARTRGRAVVMQPEINGELSGEVYTWGKPWARAARGRLVRAAARGVGALLRDADAFVAMSREIAKEMAAAGIREEKIALIPHGVDLDRFRPAAVDESRALRRRLGLPLQGCLIVYTGRLLRGKGLEDLVDAFARVCTAAPEAHLVIVGAGEGQSLSVEDLLHERVASAGLTARVTFTGRVDGVEEYLRAADVFAFPSVFEALGLSLIEAAACGLPSVGSRTGGIVDVIDDGGSGWLVPPGDVAALAERLAQLARDAEARRAMGGAARRIAVDRFDAADAVARYRALFAEAARKSGAPA
jgi:glycosyltransferase involved in cell wall biosynthesis